MSEEELSNWISNLISYQKSQRNLFIIMRVNIFIWRRSMTDEEKKEYQKAYYEANKAKVKAYKQSHKDEAKAYRAARKDKIKAYQKTYYEANKAKCKAYYKANKEEINAKAKAYRQSHKEEINAKNKAYYKANKQSHKTKAKAYSESHREYYLRKYYCINLEEVENYNLAKKDNFKGWDIHHRLETNNSDVNLSRKELIALDMYYNRPASELIFMTRSEHNKLHHKH